MFVGEEDNGMTLEGWHWFEMRYSPGKQLGHPNPLEQEGYATFPNTVVKTLNRPDP